MRRRWNNEGGAPEAGDASVRKHPKRPRDLNQWAKHMVDVATGAIEAREPTPEEQGKSATAVKRGKAGGAKGGSARAAALTPEQRAEIARLAAQTRWKKSD
jgi:hypothetical protein